MEDSKHFLNSSYRESIIEHVFIGELLKTAWRKDLFIEISKPQVDNGGYDILMECNNCLRHVQLKASYDGASATSVNINLKLAEKEKGCVIWIKFDKESLNFQSFLWFDSLKELSTYKVAKHTKANSKGIKNERPNIRKIPKNKFEIIHSIDIILEKLFKEE